MVELRAKLTESGILYIPKEIREAFGRVIRLIPNARACVLFPDGVEYEDVLRSLRVIEADLRHRISMQRKVAAKLNAYSGRTGRG